MLQLTGRAHRLDQLIGLIPANRLIRDHLRDLSLRSRIGRYKVVFCPQPPPLCGRDGVEAGHDAQIDKELTIARNPALRVRGILGGTAGYGSQNLPLKSGLVRDEQLRIVDGRTPQIAPRWTSDWSGLARRVLSCGRISDRLSAERAASGEDARPPAGF
jgi:hypothetical protein